jgi:hypothetical protein
MLYKGTTWESFVCPKAELMNGIGKNVCMEIVQLVV